MQYFTGDTTLFITTTNKNNPDQLFTIRISNEYYNGYITYLPISGTYMDAMDEGKFDADGISITVRPRYVGFPWLVCTLQSTSTEQSFCMNTSGCTLTTVNSIDPLVEKFKIAKETLLQIIRILDEYFPGVVDHEELKGNIVE